MTRMSRPTERIGAGGEGVAVEELEVPALKAAGDDLTKVLGDGGGDAGGADFIGVGEGWGLDWELRLRRLAGMVCLRWGKLYGMRVALTDLGRMFERVCSGMKH